ncbi:MAG: hypothetical protein PF487_04490 [Bacteroidales bacterium]|jgi:DNA ligase-1|nr:hypothetical protein [Bacteroidales bacterium]
MTIKQIFDEIAAESGTNEKMNILSKYKDNELLKKVLYMANSKRVKFYIKQIPEYNRLETHTHPLEGALVALNLLSERKVTGHEAIQYLKETLMCCEPDAAYIIERIIDKDCKIGMGSRNINKVFPNLIEKTGYMGCKAFSIDLVLKLLTKGSCYSQEKMDGRFINCVLDGGEVNNESRQGEPTILDSPKFMTELYNLAQLKDCVINGELIMEGIPRYESNGIITSLISIAEKQIKGEDVTKHINNLETRHMPYREALDLIRVVAWDILTLDEYYTRTCKRKYEERLADLRATFATLGKSTLSVVETREVSSLEEVMKHFEEIQMRDCEGTVVKSKDGVWKDTKPSYQIKIKKEINLDLRITGFNYGKAGTKNEHLISSLDVESEDGLLKTSPTGLSEEKMDYVTENQEELLNTILEIKCSGISQDRDGNYSVMHPVYKKPRTDKTVANTLAECIVIDKASSLLKK